MLYYFHGIIYKSPCKNASFTDTKTYSCQCFVIMMIIIVVGIILLVAHDRCISFDDRGVQDSWFDLNNTERNKYYYIIIMLLFRTSVTLKRFFESFRYI